MRVDVSNISRVQSSRLHGKLQRLASAGTVWIWRRNVVRIASDTESNEFSVNLGPTSLRVLQ